MTLISDVKVGILAGEGVNQSEVGHLREALETHGVRVEIISPHGPEVKAWKNNDWGNRIKVDVPLHQATPGSYHALLLPGGPLHADELRNNTGVIDFIRQCCESRKTIGAVGHGVQILINAGSLDGRKIACPPSLQTDLAYSGATVADADVCQDEGLITCGCEAGVTRFSAAFLDALQYGAGRGRTVL